MSSTPVGRDELGELFRSYESSPDQFRIGAENEKFGVHEKTGRPLGYGGDFSVCQVLRFLQNEYGWEPIREVDEGPVLGLKRGGANITLEPGAQLELSGRPLSSLHEIAAEQDQHLAEIAPISREMGLAWLLCGFHPSAKLESLPWVPKQRYPIMRAYLPSKGSGALDMMQRTATVQGNFDWSSERDGMRKVVVALKLSPLIHAWFVNAPFKEGKITGSLSERGHVWRHMDPSRSGLLPALWTKQEPTYNDYVEWALDAGMFLFRRDGNLLKNTGQTFRQFMNDGYQGHQATLADFQLHLTTLFPEVRLKNTLEVRSADSLPPELSIAMLALWTGVLYDEQALSEAEALVAPFTHEGVQKERSAMIDRGLHAPVLGRSGFSWAESLLEIARGGLVRRALQDESGESEEKYLAAAEEILKSRVLPAERILERYRASGSFVEATRLLPAE